MQRRPTPRSLCLVALCALLLASPAAGQAVVGTVREAGTARPLEGAYLILTDSAGTRLASVLTGPAGGFALNAPRRGRYRIVAELIGYRGTTTDWIRLAPGPFVRHDIDVAVEAVSLTGIRVETGERCHRRPGSGPQTARLWEEARKALEVARWSQDHASLRFRIVEHESELDARTLRAASRTEKERTGWHNRSPYRSIPADRLHRGGYIQAGAGNDYHYYSPDADVLLSDSFLGNHCFRVVEAPLDEPDLIGLGFEPVPERRLPEIEGVLWLDRATAELRRLEFRYVGLPYRSGDWPQVGGRVEFARLGTGAWIIPRWYLRMPLRAEETGGYGNSLKGLLLTALVEQGAEVRAARTADGRVLYPY